MRITIAIPILVALFGIPRCLLRVMWVMDPNSFEYGTRGDGIGLVRCGARALWGAMMKRMVADGHGQVRCTVFDGNKI